MTNMDQRKSYEDRFARGEVTFSMSEASIVAHGDLCGPWYEAGLDLNVSEGRTVLWARGEEDNDLPGAQLEYQCCVNVKGAADADWTGSRAWIVVKGKRDHSVPFQIEGSGLIGRRAGGEVEAIFKELPEMFFPDDVDDYDRWSALPLSPVDDLTAAIERKLGGPTSA